jgi:hypothetical protein
MPTPVESPNLPCEIPSRAARWLALAEEALKETAKGRRGNVRAKQDGVLRQLQPQTDDGSLSPKKREVA